MIKAAKTLGLLVAQDFLSHTEALAALVDAARAAEVRGDPTGWRSELSANLNGWIAHWRSAAAKAERDIGKALYPLLLDGARSSELFAEARARNAAHGGALRDDDVQAMVRRMIAAELRRGRGARVATDGA